MSKALYNRIILIGTVVTLLGVWLADDKFPIFGLCLAGGSVIFMVCAYFRLHWSGRND